MMIIDAYPPDGIVAPSLRPSCSLAFGDIQSVDMAAGLCGREYSHPIPVVVSGLPVGRKQHAMHGAVVVQPVHSRERFALMPLVKQRAAFREIMANQAAVLIVGERFLELHRRQSEEGWPFHLALADAAVGVQDSPFGFG